MTRRVSLLLLSGVALLGAGEFVQPGTEYKQPQLASRGNDFGLVFGSGNSIYYSASKDRGKTFQPPVLVATAATLSLGNHRGPRLAFTTDGLVITSGVSTPKAQYGPNTLESWRSTDGGKTWGAGPAISAPESAGMGFHALASDGAKKLWSVWLGPVNGHPQLFAAHSENAGATWSNPRIIYSSATGVCECCHPSVAIDGDGRVTVMFRNNLNGARDLYLATSRDGESFQTAKLGEGTWPINACPMDGGGMAQAGGKIQTVWRRQSELFLAKPDGKPEQDLGMGKNAAIAMNDQGVFLVWQSGETLMARTPRKSQSYVLAKTGSYPSIAGGETPVAAWEDNGVIRTERLE